MEKWKNLLFLRASQYPMATVAYWAKAQLASPARQPLVQAMLQRTARARRARPCTVRSQRTLRGAVLTGMPVAQWR
jgi:hypothetical protein